MTSYQCVLLAVEDMAVSRAFYCNLFGLHVQSDFGANIAFEEGIALQTKATWAQFLEKPQSEIRMAGNDAELYFEETQFDVLIEQLRQYPNICYVHPPKEHAWGQRVVRFYDPDFHIIEVGEDMRTVCRRFLAQGLSVEQTALRTQHSVEFVRGCV